MRANRLTLMLYVVLSLLTAGYCWLIWLGMGAFQAWMPAELAEYLPLVSRVAMSPLLQMPYHAFHWQLLAAAILLGCALWGAWRSRESGGPEAHLLPAVVVVAWILLSVCWHLVGALVPMVSVAQVLAPCVIP